MASVDLSKGFRRKTPTIHRSTTLPASLTIASESGNATGPTGPDTVEILFAHHTARIVSFSSSIQKSDRSLSASPVADNSTQSGEPVGILPWASRTERTVAAGPLSVYRLPGLVAFLKSGRTLHPILAKSRCWCVDGETKFVLRIRENSYYRIELPNICEEDKKIANNLKLTFAKVLQYETTPCPFRRGFYIELPDTPETAKRPWKPKHMSTSMPLEAFDSSKLNSAATASLEDDEDSPMDREHEVYLDHAEPETPSKLVRRDSSLLIDTQDLAVSVRSEHVEAMINNFEEVSHAVATQDIRLGPMAAYMNDEHSENDDCLNAVNGGKSNQAMGSTSPPISTGARIVGAVEDQWSLQNANQKHTLLTPGLVNPLQETPTPSLIQGQALPQTQFKTTTSTSLSDFNNPDITGHRQSSHRLERTLTAPTKLETQFHRNGDPGMKITGITKPNADAISVSSSSDSFHSLHSPLSSPESLFSSSMTASPTFEDCRAEFTTRDLHNQSLPKSTITALTKPISLSWDHPATCKTGCVTAQDLKKHTSTICPHTLLTGGSLPDEVDGRLTNSPLPSVANIYAPGIKISNFDVAITIFQQTYSILLGPPIQVVAIMMKLVRGIANIAIIGENVIPSMGNSNPPYSPDSNDEGPGRGSAIWEDDYGLPLHGFPSRPMAGTSESETQSSFDCNNIR